MRQLKTFGHIKQGKLFISYRQKFDNELALFPDCRVEVIVNKLFRKRSLPQNAYYFGYLINEFIEGYLDMTGEKINGKQAHEMLKTKFNSDQFVNKETGEILNVPKTTSTLTTVQFMEYTEECSRFIAEWFNRTILAPNEQTEIEL